MGPEKRWGCIAKEKKKEVEKDEEEPYRGVNQGFHTDEAEAKDQGEGER